MPGSGRRGRTRSAGPRRALLLGVALSTLLTVSPSARAVSKAPAFEASFLPPGILAPGEPVTQVVDVETPTFDDPAPKGTLYVRGGGATGFLAVPLTWSDDRRRLSARIPASALSGDVLDEYAVVRDPADDVTLTVPPEGAAGPDRSWIVKNPITGSVPKHRFGHTRDPNAIVARAKPGDGPGEVGFTLPGQDPVEAPTSFGIAPDGTVWVLDEGHERLLGWDPGHPGRPSRTVSLDFGAGDLAVGPDGTIYVSGTKVGDKSLHMRLYAFTPDGHELWMGRLLSETFNTQIRIGADGVVYGVEALRRWAPATNAAGRPLRVADQLALAQPWEPVTHGRELVAVSSLATCRPCPATPAEARVALAGPSGNLDRSWRVLSGNDSMEFDIEALEATPTMVHGDPLVVFGVYDFDRHLLEHQVMQLSRTGIARRFSLDRGWWHGSNVVTGILVGPDGDLYQLQTDPSFGLRIARYTLGSAPSPTPTQTTTPSTVPSPTLPTAAAPSEPQSGGPSSRVWLTLGVAGAALIGVPALILRWRRRRVAGSPAGGSAG